MHAGPEAPACLPAAARPSRRACAPAGTGCRARRRRRTAALLRLGHAVIHAYERLKRSAGALDFADLIEQTADLLATPGRRAWVLYKLDGGIDHILVDEAQDTGPRQWAIVAR